MKERLVNDRYRVVVPDHIADWDAPSEWERARFLSMEKHLKQGDNLFDIGTEKGWQSAIYAQFVGGRNMALFEPSELFWPNIRKTWEANNLALPYRHFVGSVGSKSSDELSIEFGDWNPLTEGPIATEMSYGNISEGQVITINDFIELAGFTPDAITMDVEGAEYEVLKGAEKTLKEVKPKVWLSMHPDLMEKDYGATEQEVNHYMTRLGYREEDLGWDGHESHRYWYPV